MEVAIGKEREDTPVAGPVCLKLVSSFPSRVWRRSCALRSSGPQVRPGGEGTVRWKILDVDELGCQVSQRDHRKEKRAVGGQVQGW